MIPDHYSFTQMSVYHDCHRKYYMKYVLGEQRVLSVRLLEGDLFHRRIAGATCKDVSTAFYEKKNNYSFATRDTPTSILKGIETAYGLYQMWHNSCPYSGEVRHEVDLSVTLGDVLGDYSAWGRYDKYLDTKDKPVKMIADIVVSDPPIIIDVKLRAGLPDRVSCREELQLGLYAIAGEKMLGARPTLGVLSVSYAAGGGIKLIDLPECQRAKDEAKWSLLSFVRDLDHKDFAKTPSLMCGKCEYAELCSSNKEDFSADEDYL